MVDASHVTKEPHKISSGAAILLLPFSSFGSSFIDYQLYRLARPSCRARASIDWVANSLSTKQLYFFKEII